MKEEWHKDRKNESDEKIKSNDKKENFDNNTAKSKSKSAHHHNSQRHQ